MSEVYEDVKEFGKALVETLKPYYKSHKESETSEKIVYTLTGKNRDVEIYFHIMLSEIYKDTKKVLVYVKKGEHETEIFNAYVKATTVDISIVARLKYTDEIYVGIIDVGYTLIHGNTLEIEIRKDTKSLMIHSYD
jgi:hypothetical protein